MGGELPAPNATFLGLGRLPREVTAVQVEVFFQFSADEPGLSKSAVGLGEGTPPSIRREAMALAITVAYAPS